MVLPVDPTVTLVEIAIGAAAARHMIAIVRAGEGGPLGHSEVGFDGVEPGGVGRRPHGMDVQVPEQRQEARMIMDIVQVTHDAKRRVRG
jgi:hypothetical protein